MRFDFPSIQREPAHWPQLLAHGVLSGDGLVLDVPDALAQSLPGPLPPLSRLPPPPAPGRAAFHPRPHLAYALKPWPILLRPLRKLAQPGEHGLGDILARLLAPLGGTTYKRWHLQFFGRPCGCSTRQSLLNHRYPL